MKTIVAKFNGCLLPVGQESCEAFEKLNYGKEYQANITMPRNLKFTKKYFALVSTLFDMQETYSDKDVFRKVIQIAGGHFDLINLPDGRTVTAPKSIAFHKMPEDEFADMYSRILDYSVCTFGVDRDAVERIIQFA